MFGKQDLKMYVEKDLLAFVKSKEFKIEIYYSSKTDLLKVYAEFLTTDNFKCFMKQNYNCFVKNSGGD